ncbi:MAG: 1,4-dihydroxy-6-naphthoate synthase [Prevotellaceae bacterium]|jgi:1,4-dihydroxy-6-naphthoate synthase|nr:1,4-dihydroxy-6-naphthoate synthase [Prevotellaceae bacterium]
MKKIKLAFSPCPNDTFIFDAIVNKKIDLEGLDFEVTIADVEELNKKAIEGKLDLTKLSYYAYALMSESFDLCKSGSALGYGNGPLLVSKQRILPNEVRFLRIAVPGRYTTANFLLKHAFPGVSEPLEYLFSDIENAVVNREVDAGVLIHEGRFTYARKGLRLITDLGDFWEKTSGHPIPLGCIAMRRTLPEETRHSFDRVMTRSVLYALENPKDSKDFVAQHAQNQEPEIIQKHIDFFVNKFTVELGDKGQEAVNHFIAKVKKICKLPDQPILPAN